MSLWSSAASRALALAQFLTRLSSDSRLLACTPHWESGSLGTEGNNERSLCGPRLPWPDRHTRSSNSEHAIALWQRDWLGEASAVVQARSRVGACSRVIGLGVCLLPVGYADQRAVGLWVGTTYRTTPTVLEPGIVAGGAARYGHLGGL